MKLPDKCLADPALTLTIASGTTPPRDRLVDVDYNQETFWIPSLLDQADAHQQSDKWVNPYPPRWNGEIFSMLYEIFEFNRTDQIVTTPAITISK